MSVQYPQPISVFISDLVTAQEVEMLLSSDTLSIEQNYTQHCPSYFSEGDTLATLRCANVEVKLIAPSEGYYSHILPYNNFKIGNAVCFRFASEKAAWYYGYNIEFAAYNDPITEELSIRWKGICSYAVDGFYTMLAVIKLDVQGGNPYISFSTDREKQLRKGDEVIFLLQEEGIKQIIKFTITQAPQKTASNRYIVRVPILEDDLIYLQQFNLELVRFVFKNGREDLNCTLGTYGKDSQKMYMFKCYASCYCNILRQNNIIIPKFEKISSVQDSVTESQDDGCYVYLMIDTTNGFHKIGISNKPEYRERTLQSEKPTIELLCAKQYPSRVIAEAIESALHKAYENKRLRGEWFNLSEEEVLMLKETLQ